MRDKLWQVSEECSQSDLQAIMDQAECPETTSGGLLVASGLKAARIAQASHRRSILTDVANVLNCTADELGFLFMDPVVAANDSDPVRMPDFRVTIQSGQLAVLG